jgi:acyl CoA:acetate/3-ketoacid CoA transferase
VKVRFPETGKPAGLTLIQACGFGDDRDSGANHFAHPGMVRRAVVELVPGAVINLGFGIAAGLPVVAVQERLIMI